MIYFSVTEYRNIYFCMCQNGFIVMRAWPNFWGNIHTLSKAARDIDVNKASSQVEREQIRRKWVRWWWWSACSPRYSDDPSSNAHMFISDLNDCDNEERPLACYVTLTLVSASFWPLMLVFYMGITFTNLAVYTNS